MTAPSVRRPARWMRGLNPKGTDRVIRPRPKWGNRNFTDPRWDPDYGGQDVVRYKAVRQHLADFTRGGD